MDVDLRRITATLQTLIEETRRITAELQAMRRGMEARNRELASMPRPIVFGNCKNVPDEGPPADATSCRAIIHEESVDADGIPADPEKIELGLFGMRSRHPDVAPGDIVYDSGMCLMVVEIAGEIIRFEVADSDDPEG